MRSRVVGRRIADQFADGKWHALEAIARHHPSHSIEEIHATLDNMVRHKTFNVRCERQTVGHGLQYRIFKKEKLISVDEVATKLAPFIQGLTEEGKKNMATMSPGTVARLAALLQRQIDEWSE